MSYYFISLNYLLLLGVITIYNVPPLCKIVSQITWWFWVPFRLGMSFANDRSGILRGESDLCGRLVDFVVVGNLSDHVDMVY